MRAADRDQVNTQLRSRGMPALAEQAPAPMDGEPTPQMRADAQMRRIGLTNARPQQSTT